MLRIYKLSVFLFQFMYKSTSNADKENLVTFGLKLLHRLPWLYQWLWQWTFSIFVFTPSVHFSFHFAVLRQPYNRRIPIWDKLVPRLCSPLCYRISIFSRRTKDQVLFMSIALQNSRRSSYISCFWLCNKTWSGRVGVLKPKI